MGDVPLSGKLIVVTRPRHQAGSLAERLRALGAQVVEAPAIRIVPLEDWGPVDAALDRLATYDWIVFTSVNAVEAFFGRLAAPLPARLRFAAIGPATAEALVGRRVTPEVVPERFIAEDVYRALSDRVDLTGKKFLLPRADIAREALPRLLREAGADVDVVAIYRTVPAKAEIAQAAALVAEGKVGRRDVHLRLDRPRLLRRYRPDDLGRKAAAGEHRPDHERRAPRDRSLPPHRGHELHNGRARRSHRPSFLEKLT